MGDLGYNAIKNKGGCFIFYIFVGLTVSIYYSHAIYLSRNEWDIDLPGGGRSLSGFRDLLYNPPGVGAGFKWFPGFIV